MFRPVVGVAALQFLIGHAASLTPWNVTADALARQLWMSSIILGDWLYIDGGEYFSQGAVSFSQIKFPPTLSIDLSKSWTNNSVVVNQLNSTSDVLGHEGLFWQESSKSILRFGGDSYKVDETKESIYALKVPDVVDGTGTWSQIHNPKDAMWQHVTWPINPSIASSPTAGFVLGGYAQIGSNTEATALLGLTIVNTTDDTYTTSYDVGSFSSSGGVVMGAGQFVPSFGTEGQGVVIFLGGMLFSDTDSNTMHPMSQLTIYDVASKTWYSQTATGDVPKARKNICITGALGTNTSTYEIFIYGGSGVDFFSVKNDDSTQVYILTLPAMRWIRTPAKTAPRSGSSCQTIKNQMLSFGGWNPTQATSFASQDPWPYGIGVFDLTSLIWKTEFNPNASPYVQSDLVTKFYASNPAYPVWDDAGTAKLFTIASSTNPGSTTPTTTPPASSSTSPPPSPSKAPVGAIAGGVVGGVAVLAALLSALWFCYLRPARKAKQETAIYPPQDPNNLPELHGGTLYHEMGLAPKPAVPTSFYHPIKTTPHQASELA